MPEEFPTPNPESLSSLERRLEESKWRLNDANRTGDLEAVEELQVDIKSVEQKIRGLRDNKEVETDTREAPYHEINTLHSKTPQDHLREIKRLFE